MVTTMRALRLMTYNVRYFGHRTRGVLSTPHNLRRIAESIARLEPLCDVICLQEVEGRSLRSRLATWRPDRPRTQLEDLAGELDRALARRGCGERYRAHYFPAHAYRLTPATNLYTTGLAILVRPRLQVVAHNLGRLLDITCRRVAMRLKQTRICAHVTVRAPDVGELDVFNTHISLPGPSYPEFWTGEARLGFGPNQLLEATRLVEIIGRRRRSDHAVLVGDFNSLPGSPVDTLLREQGNFVDALGECHGMSLDRRRLWPTAGFMSMRMAIDRIYSSPGVRWLDLDGSAPFDRPGERRNRFAGLSDHVPIVGRLRLE
jgi:endonuclease/exonuclease/phosphatase family metal-dependent hydrolase